MKASTEKDEKRCWVCKRIVVGAGKFVVCPACVNKYGSGAAFVVLGVLGRKVLQNGGKIVKGTINVIKMIKF